VSVGELYLDRGRAGSFCAVAAQYDRFRPDAPDAHLDDLAATRPARVLDVACGTGKVARALIACGLSVLGVEPDPRMAALARDRGVTVEIGDFETWDDRGRRFDLLTCGDAWHWIDPVRGLAKAADVLTGTGTVARFWNYQVLDPDVIAAFEAVYAAHAPGTHTHGHGPSGRKRPPDAFADNPLFQDVRVRTYSWERTLSGAEWVSLATTYSDHQRLAPERLRALQEALRATIDRLGGTVRAHGGTYLVLARRAAGPGTP
jgi:SAM-dependent methyltransferase